MLKTTHYLYGTWTAMNARCYTPSDTSYPFYGAKGVRVCDKWRKDFWAFVADMGERPAGMTLDRIKSDKDYEPDNCRWATRKEQSRQNRRMSVFEGKLLSRGEIAERLGITQAALTKRIMRGAFVPVES